MLNKQKQSGFTLLELLISVTILAIILTIIMGAMRLASRAFDVGDKRIDKYQRIRVMYDFITEDIRSMVVFDSNLKPIVKKICPEGAGCRIEAPLFIGEQNRITFLTTNPGLAPSLLDSKYRIVTYYLNTEAPSGYERGDLKGIIMQEEQWPLLNEDFFKPVCDSCSSEKKLEDEPNKFFIEPISLYPDVIGCSFEYFGQKALDAEPTWYDDWNSMEKICECNQGSIEKNFPIKIKATIIYSSADEGANEGDTEELSFEIPILVSLTNSKINSATFSSTSNEKKEEN